jgi:hypothetical protein
MRRRIAIVLGLVMVTAQHAPPAASQAAAPQVAAPQAAAPRGPAIAFAAEAGLLLSPIAPAQTAVFEDVMAKVREGLEKSTDPIRKQQAAGWKIYKSADPFQGFTLYVSVMDPAVKGADYNVFEILKETMTDAEARALFEQFRTAFGTTQSLVSMSPFMSMAPVAVEKKQAAGSRQ